MRERQYEGGTWRILSYRNVRKSLKRLRKKDKRRYFASGLARKPPFFDIKKNHAIVAWFGRALPMSLEIKTPIVYNESKIRQSEIKYTIGGY